MSRVASLWELWMQLVYPSLVFFSQTMGYLVKERRKGKLVRRSSRCRPRVLKLITKLPLLTAAEPYSYTFFPRCFVIFRHFRRTATPSTKPCLPTQQEVRVRTAATDNVKGQFPQSRLPMHRNRCQTAMLVMTASDDEAMQ